MNIVKCLMLRSSMIGIGAVVGGLALAVWHFAGSQESPGKVSATVPGAAAKEIGPADAAGMIPVKDLDPAPIKPPSKALLDGDLPAITSTSSFTDQSIETKISAAESAFPVTDQDPLKPGTDFPVVEAAEETPTGSPASSTDFSLPPANLSSGELADPAPVAGGGNFPTDPPAVVAANDELGTSPAALPLPSAPEAIPLLPPASAGSNDAPVISALPTDGAPVLEAPLNPVLSDPGGPLTVSEQPAGQATGLESALPLALPALSDVGGDPALDQARPGKPQFDGQQAPKLTIEKRAPAEIQVNQLATFETRVRNVGQVPAHDVRVRDFVPRGTRLERASPAVVPAVNGGLTWNLGTLQPGQEVTISMQLMPLEEGQIGSVATVDFQARASVRTTCTKPQLIVKQSVPGKVLIGKDVTVSITISNSGSGDATSLVLVEDVPEQLTHAAGRELEYPIGTLKPGETKQLALKLRASKAGLARNVLALRGTGKVYVEDVVQLEVIAPQLQVAMTGPKVRYLERPAKYAVTVANPGTAPANNVELVAYLPKGLKFVEADHHGRYDANHHAVLWSLEELPANVRDSVSVTALPIEAGEQRLRLEGRASLGLTHQFEHLVQVESAAQLLFRVTDLTSPIETGNDTTYEIRVTNVGTRAATGIRLGAALSPALQPLSGNGPSAVAIQGQQVFFEPLERIAPRGEAIYKITAKGLQQGDHLIRVQVISNESPAPVTKEESTRVYQDR